MAGDVKVAVTFSALPNTSTGFQNYTKAGFGTVGACIVLVGRDLADNTVVTVESRMSIGFSDITNDYCITHQDQNNSAKVDCDALKSNTKAYVILDDTGGVDIDGGVSAVTDGIRLTNTTSNSGQRVFATVILFGGADLGVSLQRSSIASSQNSTATIAHSGEVDGNDKLIFFIGTDISGEDSASTGINNSFGVCHATGSDAGGWTFVQRCIGWTSDHNNAVGSPSAILSTDRVLDIITEAGSQDWGLEVTALDHSPAQWTVTTRDNGSGAGMEVYSLALDLDDRKAKIDSIDGPTASGDWSEAGVGFKPQYVGLCLTMLSAENGIFDNSLGGVVGFSSNTGVGEETVHAFYNEDVAAITNTNNQFRSRAIYLFDAGIFTIQFDLSHSSFDSGGWTYSQVGSPSVTRKWFYWAIEEAAGVGLNIIVPLKTFTKTAGDHSIETGVNIPVPVPKDFNVIGQIPAAGTSVLIPVPVPEVFTKIGFDPTVQTGVNVLNQLGGFNLTGFDPVIKTGVNVLNQLGVFNITGFDPVIIASDAIVDVIVPLGGFDITSFDPTVQTGVTIITPLGTFNLTGFDPIIKTGVLIIVPNGVFNITGFDPLISIGVQVINTLGVFNITGFDPAVASGVNIPVGIGGFSITGFDFVIKAGEVNVLTPVGVFNINGNVPIVNIGVNVINPLGGFNLTKFDPLIQTGVTIITPLGTFNLTGFEPNIGTSVIIITPLGSFTVNFLTSSVASGSNIVVPIGSFSITGFASIVGTGVNLDVPIGSFTITGFDPLVSLLINIKIPPSQFTITGFAPTDIIALFRAPLGLNELDLTPPFEDISQTRYLHRNFAMLRDVLDGGLTVVFETADGKTIHVRNGVIVNIFTT